MPGASETTICCQITWGILVCAYIQLRSGDKALQRKIVVWEEEVEEGVEEEEEECAADRDG